MNRKIFLVISIFIISCGKQSIVDNNTIKSIITEAEKKYESPYWTDRLRAVQSAGETKAKEAEPLMNKALADYHKKVRIAAIEALSHIETVSALQSIEQLVDKEKDVNVKWAIVKSLAARKSISSFPVFIKALSDTEWLIRESAVIGLCSIDDSEIRNKSIPYIVNSLADPNESVRIAVIKNLQVQDKRIYYLLSGMIADKNLSRRPDYLISVLNALSMYKLDEATRRIIILYFTHPSANVRIAALNCVKKSDMAD